MLNAQTAGLHRWGARPLTEAERAGYLDWSLDFFTDATVDQDPFIDITLQLDVTRAYARYRAEGNADLSFFAFLIWHLAQALQTELGFRLRQIDGQWWVLDNAPIVVPVAIGGTMRFCELLLQDASQQTLPLFARQYQEQLNAARAGQVPRMDPDTFLTACFIGNLPYLQFTALKLHSRKSNIQCAPGFYFGQRYQQGERLMMPLAVRLHHACTDPYVLNALLERFLQAFE